MNQSSNLKKAHRHGLNNQVEDQSVSLREKVKFENTFSFLKEKENEKTESQEFGRKIRQESFIWEVQLDMLLNSLEIDSNLKKTLKKLFSFPRSNEQQSQVTEGKGKGKFSQNEDTLFESLSHKMWNSSLNLWQVAPKQNMQKQSSLRRVSDFQSVMKEKINILTQFSSEKIKVFIETLLFLRQVFWGKQNFKQIAKYLEKKSLLQKLQTISRQELKIPANFHTVYILKSRVLSIYLLIGQKFNQQTTNQSALQGLCSQELIKSIQFLYRQFVQTKTLSKIKESFLQTLISSVLYHQIKKVQTFIDQCKENSEYLALRQIKKIKNIFHQNKIFRDLLGQNLKFYEKVFHQNVEELKSKLKKKISLELFGENVQISENQEKKTPSGSKLSYYKEERGSKTVKGSNFLRIEDANCSSISRLRDNPLKNTQNCVSNKHSEANEISISKKVILQSHIKNHQKQLKKKYSNCGVSKSPSNNRDSTDSAATNLWDSQQVALKERKIKEKSKSLALIRQNIHKHIFDNVCHASKGRVNDSKSDKYSSVLGRSKSSVRSEHRSLRPHSSIKQLLASPLNTQIEIYLAYQKFINQQKSIEKQRNQSPHQKGQKAIRGFKTSSYQSQALKAEVKNYPTLSKDKAKNFSEAAFKKQLKKSESPASASDSQKNQIGLKSPQGNNQKKTSGFKVNNFGMELYSKVKMFDKTNKRELTSTKKAKIKTIYKAFAYNNKIVDISHWKLEEQIKLSHLCCFFSKKEARKILNGPIAQSNASLKRGNLNFEELIQDRCFRPLSYYMLFDMTAYFYYARLTLEREKFTFHIKRGYFELDLILPRGNNVLCERYETIWPTIRYLFQKKMMRFPILKLFQNIFYEKILNKIDRLSPKKDKKVKVPEFLECAKFELYFGEIQSQEMDEINLCFSYIHLFLSMVMVSVRRQSGSSEKTLTLHESSSFISSHESLIERQTEGCRQTGRYKYLAKKWIRLESLENFHLFTLIFKGQFEGHYLAGFTIHRSEIIHQIETERSCGDLSISVHWREDLSAKNQTRKIKIPQAVLLEQGIDSRELCDFFNHILVHNRYKRSVSQRLMALLLNNTFFEQSFHGLRMFWRLSDKSKIVYQKSSGVVLHQDWYRHEFAKHRRIGVPWWITTELSKAKPRKHKRALTFMPSLVLANAHYQYQNGKILANYNESLKALKEKAKISSELSVNGLHGREADFSVSVIEIARNCFQEYSVKLRPDSKWKIVQSKINSIVSFVTHMNKKTKRKSSLLVTDKIKSPISYGSLVQQNDIRKKRRNFFLQAMSICKNSPRSTFSFLQRIRGQRYWVKVTLVEASSNSSRERSDRWMAECSMAKDLSKQFEKFYISSADVEMLFQGKADKVPYFNTSLTDNDSSKTYELFDSQLMEDRQSISGSRKSTLKHSNRRQSRLSLNTKCKADIFMGQICQGNEGSKQLEQSLDDFKGHHLKQRDSERSGSISGSLNQKFNATIKEDYGYRLVNQQQLAVRSSDSVHIKTQKRIQLFRLIIQNISFTKVNCFKRILIQSLWCKPDPTAASKKIDESSFNSQILKANRKFITEPKSSLQQISKNSFADGDSSAKKMFDLKYLEPFENCYETILCKPVKILKKFPNRKTKYDFVIVTLFKIELAAQQKIYQLRANLNKNETYYACELSEAEISQIIAEGRNKQMIKFDPKIQTITELGRQKRIEDEKIEKSVVQRESLILNLPKGKNIHDLSFSKSCNQEGKSQESSKSITVGILNAAQSLIQEENYGEQIFASVTPSKSVKKNVVFRNDNKKLSFKNAKNFNKQSKGSSKSSEKPKEVNKSPECLHVPLHLEVHPRPESEDHSSDQQQALSANGFLVNSLISKLEEFSKEIIPNIFKNIEIHEAFEDSASRENENSSQEGEEELSKILIKVGSFQKQMTLRSLERISKNKKTIFKVSIDERKIKKLNKILNTTNSIFDIFKQNIFKQEEFKEKGNYGDSLQIRRQLISEGHQSEIHRLFDSFSLQEFNPTVNRQISEMKSAKALSNLEYEFEKKYGKQQLVQFSNKKIKNYSQIFLHYYLKHYARSNHS